MVSGDDSDECWGQQPAYVCVSEVVRAGDSSRTNRCMGAHAHVPLDGEGHRMSHMKLAVTPEAGSSSNQSPSAPAASTVAPKKPHKPKALSVQAPFLSTHLSLHCLPMRPGSCDAMRDHLLVPCWATSSTTRASSCHAIHTNGESHASAQQPEHQHQHQHQTR